ncbi:hypothetical protein D9M68_492630 [compost metagenome]
MVVGVAAQHVAAVLQGLHQHVRAGAHGPGIERQIVRRHAGLAVEAVGLPGDGRREGHGQPVLELRVLAVDADAQRLRVKRLHAGKAVRLAQVQPGRRARAARHIAAQRLVPLAQAFAVFLQARNVLGHQGGDRRHHARAGQPPDGVDVVVGREFARAGAREIGNVVLAVQLARRQRIVVVAAVGLAGERRMRREPRTGPELDFVDALRDLLARRVGGQRVALGVEVDRRVDRCRRARYQFVRTLQIVVTVERLVNIVCIGSFIAGIGAGRVQVLRGAFDESGIQRVLGFGAGRIRTVDGAFP